MTKTFLSLTTALVVAGLNAWGATPISVSTTATGPLAFDTQPTSANGWTTRAHGASSTTAIGSAATMDSMMQTIAASIINFELPSNGTVPPGTLTNAQWNSTGQYLQTRPTGNTMTLLMATLQNDAGVTLTTLAVSYDFGALVASGSVINESAGLYGQRVYWSLDGATWTVIPAFSSIQTADNSTTTLSTNINLGAWAPGAPLYLVWADDNGPSSGTAPNHEGGYTIDNITFTGGTTAVPLSVSLLSPNDGQVFVTPADVTVTANPVGTAPATSVAIFTNGNLFTTLTAAPFSATLAALPPGTYAIYARAANATETVFTSTNTITVRDRYVQYTSGTLTEDFDGMGATGTNTPIGWYAGWYNPTTSASIHTNLLGLSDGSTIGGNAGFNMGTAAASDRALGIYATGTGVPAGFPSSRFLEIQIRNNAAQSMQSFTITYDGEQWRSGNAVHAFLLTNQYSLDGVTFTEMGLTFAPPWTAATAAAALDGNIDTNRVAGITSGTITLPTPVAPGGVLYLRWYDFNDADTDPMLAIDNFSFSATLVPFEQFVQISTPTNGAVFAEGAPITVSANAGMANPVSSVEFYRDGVLISTDTNSPFSVIYSNAVPGNHTLTAIARDGLGASVTNAAGVSITVNPNVLPSVTITNPAPDGVYFVGVTVTNINASASDTDGTITGVEFYVDGYRWVTDTSSPYGFSLCSLTAGSHLVAAVAVDNAGGRATNTISISATNPPDISVIVANGSDWKFLDDGTDQGTAWRTNGFSDAGWSNGIAEFGYGDGPGRPERTVVSFGTNTTTKHATTYFRKAFTVTNPGSVTNLILRLLLDDHAIVYLNGTQVFSDMTNAVVNYNTYEQPDSDTDGAAFIETNIAAGLLIPGVNVLAVELHQNAANSSDISFDLMLWGQGNAAPAGPQFGFGLVGNNLVFSWPDSFTGFTLKEATNITANTVWQDSSLTPVQGGGKFTVTVPATGPRKYFELSK